MKIAVTYENGQVFQHFGHTEHFKIYTCENGKVVSSLVVSPNGIGHGALGEYLRGVGAEVLLCGGIGGGAQNALTNAGIKFFGGVSGDADKAVEAYLDGKLEYDPNAHCDHHGEGHECGGHHEEGHQCGCGGHGHEHHGEAHKCGCGNH